MGYVAAENRRTTPLTEKRAFYGWTLVNESTNLKVKIPRGFHGQGSMHACVWPSIRPGG
jgi:hypothetical protein